MKNNNGLKLITILIPIVIIILYAIRGYILNLLPFVPPCPFYSQLHLYCPACGNTRSVLALLHGDIMASLRYNIVPILFIIFSVLAYIELATYSFGKPIRLLPRKFRFYMTLLAILILYMIIRNFIPYLTP